MDEVSAVGERAEFSFAEQDEPDGSVRVCLVGELDAAEAPGVQEALRRLEGEGIDVLLDVSGLSFMDLFGLHVIGEAADAARQGGFGFAIAGPVPDTVRQVFVGAGAEHHLPGGQAHLVAPLSTLRAHGDVGAAPMSAVDRDRTAADEDQTSADLDQTSSDEDQTGSDRDQAGSDADQRGSDRDQVAADRDQVAADRDHADSDGDGPAAEATYERSRQTRRHTSRARDDRHPSA